MEEYLFHYTPRSGACHILRTGQLKLSPFTRLNDPKEVVEWVSYVAGRHVAIKRDAYKVLCLSQGPYSELKNSNPLESGWAMGNMWAHYANRYDGLCLIFDKDKLSSCFQSQFGEYQVFDEPVIYSNDLQCFSDMQASDPHHPSVMNYLLFHKFNWWSNENEYRWVIKHNDEDKYLFVEYLDSLVAIVIGENYPLECRAEVYKFTEISRTIKVYDLQNQNGMPYLSEHLSDREFREWRKHKK